MSRAAENEMTFVLLARDVCAPDVIRYWCQQRINEAKNNPEDAQILEALACAEEMERQRSAGKGAGE